MGVFKIYLENRDNSAYKGMAYARAAYLPKTVTTLELARRIQKNVSVKISDVVAVLAELSDVINIAICNSEKVKLDGLGTFKAALSSIPAPTPADFSAATHITKSRVLFTAEVDPERSNASERSPKTLLRGIRWANIADMGVGVTNGATIATLGVSPTSGNAPLTVTISNAVAGAQIQRRKGLSGSWSNVTLNGSSQDTISSAGDYYYRQVVNGNASAQSAKVTVAEIQMP